MQAKIDALLITRAGDVSYLTAFTGDDSAAVLGQRWAAIVTDGRFAEQARRECSDIEVHVRTGPMPAAIASVLGGRGVRHLGVQAEAMTLQERDHLAAAIGARKIRPLTDVPGALRMVKDVGEVRAIGRAVRVAERAFRELIAPGARGLVGRTERDLAAELDHRMRTGGASGPAFETIVAAGPHSSRPHHRPGSTRIRRDQPLLIDWGAVVDGYCSDLTRVVFTGRIPPKIAEVYEVVRRAQAAGIAAASVRAACGTVDAAARRVVEAGGYGEQFVHGLGHGLGLAVHEQPVLDRGVRRRLRAGMVVTVEPGVYLPGIGGVRIEDDVLVTARGGRRISTLPRAMAAMQLR